MRLDQIFKMEFLSENLLSDTKEGVLAELISLLIGSGLKIDRAKALDVLQQREKLGSTGIGDGVAIPHGKVSELQDMVIAFGRSRRGVAFDAIDGKPVQLFSAAGAGAVHGAAPEGSGQNFQDVENPQLSENACRCEKQSRFVQSHR